MISEPYHPGSEGGGAASELSGLVVSATSSCEVGVRTFFRAALIRSMTFSSSGFMGVKQIVKLPGDQLKHHVSALQT